MKEILAKTSDKLDEQFAVPFPQTERRELFVIVSPDQEQAERPTAATSTGDRGAACNVGRWVTVTRANGWVPSTSMVWTAIRTQLVEKLGGMFRTSQTSAEAPSVAGPVSLARRL